MPHNEFKPVLEAIEEESIEDEIEAAIKGKDHKFQSEVLSKAVKGAMKVGNFKKIGTLINIAEKHGIDVRANLSNNKTTERHGGI